MHLSLRTAAVLFTILSTFTVGGVLFWKSGVRDTSDLKPFTVSGESMEPTIASGDQVFVDISHYKTHPIEKGDIVAIKFSLSSNKIKRVIAVGGDKVEFIADSIMINGIPSPTEYLKDNAVAFNPSKLRILKIQLSDDGVLPDGTLLVLGDNRFSSEDSQQFGLVMAEQVMGKVLYKKEGRRMVNI